MYIYIYIYIYIIYIRIYIYIYIRIYIHTVNIEKWSTLKKSKVPKINEKLFYKTEQ